MGATAMPGLRRDSAIEGFRWAAVEVNAGVYCLRPEAVGQFFFEKVQCGLSRRLPEFSTRTPPVLVLGAKAQCNFLIG